MSEIWSSAVLHRAIWRWHFYAGLLCAPFMLILAVTGAIYLFNDEINDLIYPRERLVAPSQHQIALSEIASAALSPFPGGRVTRIDTPAAPGRSVQVFVSPQQGEPVRVFVDPGTGAVLGSHIYTHTLVGFADVAHGSLMLGTFGDGIVELAACWGFILTVSGLYLWWPKGGARAALLPRLGVRGRAFWKEWHAAIGLWTAVLVMFLILTGLPWANLWGDLLRRGADVAGIGYPVSHRSHGAPVTSTLTVKDATGGTVPWTLEAAPAPQSDAHEAHRHAAMAPPAPLDRPAIGLDAVAERLAAAGLSAPYRLSLPRNADGAYIAVLYPDQPEGQRTLYIDQYSGRVIDDVRYADYGVVAKAVELGVQIHMGNYFGRLNQIVMLLPCIGIVFLCLSGPYMWWRRRPKGHLGAPRALAAPTLRTLVAIILTLGLIFPLAGASLALVLACDLLFRRLAHRSRTA
ncbi:PepSY domain-containing protein [Xanthobacter sp. DSM 24535]|uniref:PepSY-associated TM helix domain-containing protein n=1 Tax=Roseixanthobacter psychrophilus TaxID=3119917 RepID=UPI0037262A7A